MSECKHGLKHGCAFCHVPASSLRKPPGDKPRTKTSRLAEKMNDRMTALKKRLRQLRGE